MPDRLIGSFLGRYRLEEFLEQTGLASIYRAQDELLGRVVAVKIVDRPKLRLRERLIDEGRLMALFKHPAIQTVYDCDAHDGEPFIVQDLLETSLNNQLHSGSPLSPDRWIDSFVSITEALDYVHRRGFIHRNLNPGVIRFDRDGNAYLTDFSLATKLDAQFDSSNIIGTPAYMAPEQTRGDQQLTPATDVWGLGAVLYELLSGTPLWAKFFGSIFETFTAITSEQFAPPRSIAPDVPVELDLICQRCLQRNPADRYQSAAQLADDLRSWRKGLPILPSEQVFVSHSSKDREFIEREIIGLLERQGLRTWYSKVSIQSAAEWERSLRDGLQSSDWFLVALSQNSLRSEWVKDEIFWAIDNMPIDRIVPVMIEDCPAVDFHIRLARIQCIDYRDAKNEPFLAQASLLRAFSAVSPSK